MFSICAALSYAACFQPSSFAGTALADLLTYLLSTSATLPCCAQPCGKLLQNAEHTPYEDAAATEAGCVNE